MANGASGGGTGGGGTGHWFRQLTPLVLLLAALAILFEPWAEQLVPGRQWFAERLGEHFVLRLCCGVLALYVLLLWGESVRLHGSLTSVLKALRDALGNRPGAASERAARQDLLRLLIAALRSDDPAIRDKSRQQLARLTGQDLGDDAGRWQQWLDAQPRAAGDGPD